MKMMKVIKTLVAMAAVALAGTALAATQEVGGLTWMYRIVDGEAEIINEDDTEKCAVTPEPTGDVVIPTTLGGKTVTRLGESALSNCQNIRSLVATTVKSIDRYAFWNCRELQTASFPVLETIGQAVFMSCPCLSTLEMPTTVDLVGHMAFASCTSLIDDDGYVIINGVLYGYYGSEKEVIIPASATRIASHSFYDRGVTDVLIPGTVKSIGTLAFSNCAITNLTIMSGVETIDPGAFRFNMDLKSVTIPGSTTICDDAFLRCEGLKNVTILNGVETIESSAFRYCPVVSISIPASVTTIGALALGTANSLEYVYVAAGDGDRVKSLLSDAGYDKKVDGFTFVTPAQACQVTFNANGGYCNASPRPVKTSTAVGELPAAMYPGYSFDGWWTTAGGGAKITKDTTVSANATYYAHWTPNTYTVTFNLNGGASVSPATKDVTFGSTYGELPTPTREGDMWEFDGWWTAANGGTRITAESTVGIAKDTVLYAHWTGDANYGTEMVGGITWTYRIVAGTAEIYNNGNAAIPTTTAGAADVPSTLGGYPVTRIGDDAFDNCQLLTRVKIPSGVTSIGNYVFHSDNALRDLSIPSTVTSIADKAFMAHSIKTIHVEAGDVDRVRALVEAATSSTIYYVVGFPANDDFSGAALLADASGSVTVSNEGATREAEPLCVYKDSAGTTLWWAWVAPGNGKATFDTVGSTFDTVMGVYAGDSLDALTVVMENDDDISLPVGSRSKVTFNTVSGRIYYIAVGGINKVSGTLTLNWDWFEAPDYATILDAPAGMTFDIGGDKPWVAGGTVDGKTAVKSGLETSDHSKESTLIATFSGAGTLSFWYKVSSESGYDYLRVKVDGVDKFIGSVLSGTIEWTPYDIVLSAGDHTVEWTYHKDSGGSAGSDCAWIAGVNFGEASSFTKWTATFNANGGTIGGEATTTRQVYDGAAVGALPTPTRDGNWAFNGWWTEATGGTQIEATTTVTADAEYFAHWLDTTPPDYAAVLGAPAGMSFASSGDKVWISGGTVDGKTTVKSGDISHSQTSVLTATFSSGTAILSFYYKVSSESGCDKLVVTVDGDEVVNASGDVSWTKYEKELAAGDHTVVWTYQKDHSQSSGSDSAWLAEVGLAEITKRTVTFNGNGGTIGGEATTTRLVTDGAAVGTLPTPTRAGYWEFLGWFTEETGGTQIYATTTVTADAEYFAHWLNTAPPDYNAVLGAPAGMTFAASGDKPWFAGGTEEEKTTVKSGNISDNQTSVLTATFSGAGVLSFYCKVDSESSCDYLVVTVDGEEFVRKAGPVSWTKYEKELAAGDHTVVWTYLKDHSQSTGRDSAWIAEVRFGSPATKYTVTFDKNEGDSVSEASREVDEGDPVGTPLPTATRAGYWSFDGWYTAATDGVKINGAEKVTGDVTYYAHWNSTTPPDYATILGAPAGMTFTPGGDKYWIDAGTVDGKTAVKSGLETTDNSKSSTLTATFSGAGTLTFYYKVSSEENYDWLVVKVDGIDVLQKSGTDVTSWTEYEQDLDAGDHTVVWTYTKDGSQAGGSDCAWIAEVRLGAPATKYTVTFDANGGDSVSEASREVKEGEAVGELPTATRSDYIQNGWWTDAEGGTEVTAATIVNAPVTYYAHWAPVADYTVTFDLNGGDSVSPEYKVVTSGQTYGSLPTPAWIGYKFVGWWTTSDDSGDQVTSSTTVTITADQTLYAHWTDLPPGYGVETVDGVQWTYRVVDGAAEIYNEGYPAIPTTTAGAIDVPSTLGGYQVTKIGDGAFEDCTLLTRVKIPSGVTSIGNFAVARAKALRDIFIPKTVTNLGGNAFIAHYIRVIHVEEGDIDRVSTLVSGVTSSTFTYVVGFPANDDFAGATAIAGASGSVNGSNVGASTEANEPLVARFADGSVAPGSTVWWTWTAPSDCQVSFDTAGSSEDTQLGVYTGAALGALTAVAENDNDLGLGTKSKVIFNAVSGQTYHIAVGGHQYYETGDITLNWTSIAVPDYATILGAPAGMTFTPGEGKPWVDAGTVDGKASVKSGNAGDNGSSSVLTATFSGPGTLSFWYKVESEPGYDKLEFFMDGSGNCLAGTYQNSGEVDWTKYEYELAAGNHTVVWKYSKDSSTSSGSDCAWIADVSFGEVAPPVQHTVTFNGNGGLVAGDVATTTLQVNDGAAVGPLPSATLTGYTLAGWFTAASGGTEIETTTPVTADVEYFAHWTPNKYTITFDANGGTGGTSQSLDYGTALTAPTVTYEGHTFNGWSPEVPATVPAENATYVAQWTVTPPTQYTVTFDPNGGSCKMSDKDVDKGTAIGDLPEPAFTGHTFVGWFTLAEGGDPVGEDYIVNSDITIYAHWTVTPPPTQYTVWFNANGGSCSKALVKVNAGEAIGALPTPTHNNPYMTFIGWFTASVGGDPVGEDYIVNANGTIYAHWRDDEPLPPSPTWTVEFNPNGGTCSAEPFVVDDGATIGSVGALPTATRTGYTQNGWWTEASGGSEVTAATTISEDTEVYAHWTANTYTVTFDKNGGDSVTPASKTVTYDATYGELPEPTRDGYWSFAGWWTEQSGGEQVTASATVKITAAQTLYAHWTDVAPTFTVSFDVNGGDGDTPAPATRKAGATVGALPSVTRTGYTQTGWWTTADDSGIEVTAATTVDADATYYAHWTPNNYTVSFAPNGGSVSPTSKTVTYDAAYGDLPTPTRAGYWDFDGWFETAEGGAQITKDTIVKITDAQTLYAHWTDTTPAPVKVTFDRNGGYSQSFMDKDVSPGTAVGELPETIRFSYNFLGWFTEAEGGEEVTEETIVTKDVTYYAHWQSIEEVLYKVTFDAQGGVASATEIERGYMEQLGAVPTATKDGCVFLGWFTAAAGGEEVTPATLVYPSFTAYAHWDNDPAPIYETTVVDGIEWTYRVLGGGTAVSLYNRGNPVIPADTKGPVVIPAKINGMKVIEVGKRAFYGCGAITCAVIPDEVNTIGDEAFAWCESLQVVQCGKKISGGVIDPGAFRYCVNLVAVEFKGAPPMYAADNIFEYAGGGSALWIYRPKSAKGWEDTWKGKLVNNYLYSAHITVDFLDKNIGPTRGTVSSSGGTEIGKKLTAKATVKKGFAFAGWYDYVNDSSMTRVTRSASYAYVVTGEAKNFRADFVTEQEDKDSLVLYLGDEYETALDGSFEIDLGALTTSYSEPKFTVKGLPAGLKYDSKTQKIAGKATKPGIYKVTVTETNASQKKATDDSSAEFTLTVPNFTDGEIKVDDSYGPFIPGVALDPVVIEAAKDCKVSGLPTGMKWTAKDIYKKGSKTEIETPANSYYGTPTKPGNYTVTFTKTTADKVKHTATATFVVDRLRHLDVFVDGSDLDKATGAGDYAANAKVNLKASTTDKTRLFSYWYDAGTGEILSRAANYSYTMSETDNTVYAVFTTVLDDSEHLATSVGDFANFDANEGVVYSETTIMQGVYVEWAVEADTVTLATIAVSGLPAGMKFTAKDIVDSKTKEVIVPANTIYGAPTAASKPSKTHGGIFDPSRVKITMTTAGKIKSEYTLDITVKEMETWAVGTFEGPATQDGDGLATLTVANTGKISGNLACNGIKWTLAAAYFDDYDEAAGQYTATVTLKNGQATDTAKLYVCKDVDDNGKVVGGYAWVGEPPETVANVTQYNWKADPWKGISADFGGTLGFGGAFDPECTGTVTLTFKKGSGTVAIKGEFGSYKPTASANLTPVSLPDEANVFYAYLQVYFPANAQKGFDGYHLRVPLIWNGTSFVLGLVEP